MRIRRFVSAVVFSALSAFGSEPTQNQKDIHLVRACAASDVELVTQLLQAGANPNAVVDDVGFHGSSLGAAIGNADIAMVELLLKAGANPNQIGRNGSPPLFSLNFLPLIAGSFEELLHTLVKAGADLNAKSASGTALIGRVAKSHLDQAKLLLKLGAKPHHSILEEAASQGHWEAFEWGLSLGLDPKEFGEKGRTLFHAAASGAYWYGLGKASERERIWEALLARGVDPLQIDEEGISPLHAAVQTSNAALVKWLIKHKADVNAKTKTGATPLILAMTQPQGYPEMDFTRIALPLIKAGASLDVKDADGKEALTHAWEAKNWAMVAGLLAEGAKSNQPSELALAAARAAADLEITPRGLFSLLNPIASKEFHPQIRDDEGTPLLIWVARAASDESVALLIEKGADVNEVDAQGRTALIWAEMIQCEPAKRVLIAAGAKTDLQDRDGRTAADFAKLSAPSPAGPFIGISDGKPTPVLGTREDGGLFGAIQRDALQEVKQFLETQPTLVNSERGEITPIALAAALGRKEIMQLLMERGANMETNQLPASSPIYQAVMNHQADALMLLLQAIDPKAVEPFAAEVFSLILQTKATPLASRLIEGKFHPGDRGRQLLATAAKAGDLKLCGQLLDLGVSVLDPSGEDLQSFTPHDPFLAIVDDKPSVLAAAALSSNPEVIRLLLRHLEEVPVAVKRDSLVFALQTAADAGNLAVIKILVEEAQVDVNGSVGPDTKSSSMRFSPGTGNLVPHARHTALSLAVASSNLDAVKFLIDQGAKIEGLDQVGLPPVSCAISLKQPELVRLLLHHRADVNPPDRDQNTALHHAAMQGDLDLVKKLVAAGSEREVQNTDGQIPSVLARQRQCFHVAEWLDSGDAP
jgi:ankyrin repeat protein